MNTNEIKEIRSRIKPGSKKMYISSLANAYVTNLNGEPVLKSFAIRNFEDLEEEDQLLYTKMMKKVLSGSLGKGLMEYHFSSPHASLASGSFQTQAEQNDSEQTGAPDGSLQGVSESISPDQETQPAQTEQEDGKEVHAEETGPQKVLYALNASRLQNEQLVRNFFEKIAKATVYTSGYYITLAALEYAVPVIDKNDEENEEAAGSGGIYRFLILAINQMKPADLGLYYNRDSNAVERKIDNDLQVLPSPMDGLLFPVFSDRAADVNHFLYYTNTPNKPNEGLLDILLDVETAPTYQQEKDAFTSLLEDVAGNELTFDMYKNIYTNIHNAVKDEEADEMQTLSKDEIQSLLEGAGVPEQKMELYSSIYTDTIGDNEVKAVNAVDTSKLSIKAADVTVSVKPEAAYKVKTKMIDGGLYLCIAIDDGLEVNGVSLNK